MSTFFRVTLLSFLFCLVLTLPVHSQQDSLREQYIQRFPDHFFLWPVIKQRRLNFEVGERKGNRFINYKPNNSFSLGLGAYLFELAFEITFAVPLDEKSRELFGTSHARDFQINALSRNWGVDVFRQKYTGFYVDDPEKFYPPDESYPQRSDVVARNFGFTVLYVFNDKRYSIKSSYNFSERQLRRGGSFLLTSTLSNFKVEADSAILEQQYQDEFGAGSAVQKLKYTTFSIAPGYAYNYIYKDFFLNGALMIGPAHNWIHYDSEDLPSKNDIKINTFTSLRLGIGFNGSRLFGGLNFNLQSRAVRFENMRFANATSTFRFLVGYRFREFGVLKKSIWEWPKELL